MNCIFKAIGFTNVCILTKMRSILKIVDNVVILMLLNCPVRAENWNRPYGARYRSPSTIACADVLDDRSLSWRLESRYYTFANNSGGRISYYDCPSVRPLSVAGPSTPSSRDAISLSTWWPVDWLIDWVRLNVPPTHYTSYGDGFLRVKWPNQQQQCQSTEGTMDFNRSCHKCSSCEWAVLKVLSKSEVQGQGRDQNSH